MIREQDQGKGRGRVLVSGAGIAGLTAAYWLEQKGWDVVIIEKAASLRKGEYIIDFAGTGWDVAARMGLEPELRRARVPIEQMRFHSGEGREKASVSMEHFIESMGVQGKYAALNRCDLEELLYEKVVDKERVELRFGASIQALEDKGDSVEVTFEGATTDTFDLVIGADGVHSNVRGLVFGDEAKFTKYLGYHVAAYRCSGIELPSRRTFGILRTPHKQAGVADLPDGDVLAYFIFERDSDAYVPREQREPLLRSVFGGMGGVVPALLDALKDTGSIYMDTTTQIEMPSWHQGRVVLIGDAAYCLTLISGQGASMAMGGAYALAEALGRHEQIEEALAAYDARLRPFVEELQAKAKKFAGSFVPSSRLGIWFTELAINWMSVGWVQRFVSKQFNIQSLFEREALQRQGA